MATSRFETLIDWGCDYVTATCDEKSAAKRLECYAEGAIRSEVAAGNELRHWSGYGYDGLASGAVQFGARGASVLIRITGQEAREHAPAVIRDAGNVSRIDFQSTVRLVNPKGHFAEFVERRAKKNAAKCGSELSVRLLRDSRKGSTVYLGRRVSDRFIRVYDKGRESQLPELDGCWRAEVQYNNQLAWRAAQQFSRLKFEPVYAAETVFLELERRGVPWLCPFLTPQLVAQLPKLQYRQSSSELKLKWLASQVAPTVKWLRDHGRLDDAIEALGLSDDLKGV